MVAFAALFLWAPLLDVEWFSSHETDAYVSRTVQFLAGLHDGSWYPRWAPDFYGGYGSPFFVFAAPLVYAIGAVLIASLGSVLAALKAVALLASLLAGLGMYALVRHETSREDAGLFAAAVYLAAPYRITDLSVRGALAEFFALGVLPVVIWAYRRSASEPDRFRAARFAALAALTHAALLLSHTLMGLWGTQLLVLIVLVSCVQAWRRNSLRNAALLVAALSFAFALSAVYTLPAIAERAEAHLETMTLGYYDAANNTLAWHELSRFGPFFFSPAVWCGLTLALLAMHLRRPFARSALVCFAAALGCMLMVSPLAKAFWSDPWLPFAAFIQFPWRLLGLGWVALAAGAGLVWAALFPSPGRATPLAAACAVALCVVVLPLTKLFGMPASSVLDSRTAIRGVVTRGTMLDEHLPRKVASAPAVAAPSLVHPAPRVQVHAWFSSAARHVVSVTVPAQTHVRLRLHDFPGWTLASSQGPGAVRYAPDPQGYAGLRFEGAGRYDCAIEFGPSRARAFALLVSALAIVALWPALHSIARKASR